MKLLPALAVLVSFALAACATEEAGTPTGSACPTTNPPTYASFGKTFTMNYCVSCHSKESERRNGAPDDVNFDSESDLVLHASAIDKLAANGPKAMNLEMPPSEVLKQPSPVDREKLGQMLACMRP